MGYSLDMEWSGFPLQFFVACCLNPARAASCMYKTQRNMRNSDRLTSNKGTMQAHFSCIFHIHILDLNLHHNPIQPYQTLF